MTIEIKHSLEFHLTTFALWISFLHSYDETGTEAPCEEQEEQDARERLMCRIYSACEMAKIRRAILTADFYMGHEDDPYEAEVSARIEAREQKMEAKAQALEDEKTFCKILQRAFDAGFSASSQSTGRGFKPSASTSGRISNGTGPTES